MRPRFPGLLGLVGALTLTTAALPPALADDVDDILGSESKPAVAKKPTTTTPAAAKKDDKAAADEDVIVVERKAFLRSKRIELGPTVALTVNDPFVQHTAIGLTFDYHLTEALSVGLRGLYFFDNLTEVIRETVRLQSVPLINRYDWAAAVTMHYIPIYGKFALFGRYVMHFDAYIGGGIGAISTSVLHEPTFVVADKAKIGPTVNVAIGARLYVTDFLALYVDLRDWFLLIDPEDAGMVEQPSYFAGNMLFGFGATIFLPGSFKFTTSR